MYDDYTTFIKNIKHYRIKANLTQEQLAELADLSVSYIKQLESGKTFKNASIVTLIKLSKALNIETEDLFKKNTKVAIKL